MRIQPLEIEVPEDDPFKNDLLGRRETVEVLTNIVGSIEGPCVLSVDAAWGAGKTTFLKMWSQHLRNEEFPVVEFNAWETDFSEEPFIALSTELTKGLQKNADESMKQKIDVMEGKAKEVVRALIPGIIKAAAAGVATATGVPLDGDAVAQTLTSLVEEKLSAYEKARKSVEDFKRTLEEMAESLSISRGGRPLVVVIDELDRCRPSYAVDLLEAAKHIFAVDHVVFVLAVNRKQLSHSVKALYGAEFDALGYLGRFFDLDFRLPEPDRSTFITALLDAIRIDDYFQRTKDNIAQEYVQDTTDLLRIFFTASDLSLRRVAQATHHLGLVYSSLRSDQYSFLISTAVALILRTIDKDLYHQFVDGEVSDLKVVDTVFNRPGMVALQQRDESHIFEAVVIAATHEKKRAYNVETINSPLARRYQELVEDIDSDNLSSDPERKRAQEILRMAQHIKQYGGSTFRFEKSVHRIELLATDLIDTRMEM